jgi:hypothetical protein
MAYQVDSIESLVLSNLGAPYTASMVSCYVSCDFTSQGECHTQFSVQDLAQYTTPHS